MNENIIDGGDVRFINVFNTDDTIINGVVTEKANFVYREHESEGNYEYFVNNVYITDLIDSNVSGLRG